MNNNNHSKNADNNINSTKGIHKGLFATITNHKLLIIVVSLIAIGTVWLLKSVQLKRQKKLFAIERTELKDSANKTIIEVQQQQLRLLVKPYVWAIRYEMLRGNIDQVNLYNNEMVKERNFHSIVIADEKGNIVSSTNKRMEGSTIISLGNYYVSAVDSATVTNINDSLLIATSPIMGFNSRLGTLFVTYDASGHQVK